ncbi:MAG: hypothetical protein ACLP50_34000 [Solirubrobacteraceae bacterium]
MTTTHTIQISVHAVERFRQRVRPGLSFEAAENELARIAIVGEVTEHAPAWHLRNCAQVAPLYLLVADVLMPLHPHRSEPDVLVATTCLALGSLSADARRYRTARRRRGAGRRSLQAALR